MRPGSRYPEERVHTLLNVKQGRRAADGAVQDQGGAWGLGAKRERREGSLNRVLYYAAASHARSPAKSYRSSEKSGASIALPAAKRVREKERVR